METPNINQWKFPCWLVGICKSPEKFEEAKEILIEDYGFVYSEVEKRQGEINDFSSLILPIPNLNLEKHFATEEPWKLFSDWGIGRARFNKDYDEITKGYRFEFKYFGKSCPWKYIKSNPMKDATKRIIDLLQPHKFINFRKEISNPYAD